MHHKNRMITVQTKTKTKTKIQAWQLTGYIVLYSAFCHGLTIIKIIVEMDYTKSVFRIYLAIFY